MNILYMLSEEAATTTNNNSWIMLVVLVVIMVAMMALSIIPQKKRQKKAQEMMNGIRVGTKVKTIGGFVGEIKAIDDAQGLFVIDISEKADGSVTVCLDKSAIYTVLIVNSDGNLAPKAEVEKVVAADDAEDAVEAQEEKKD